MALLKCFFAFLWVGEGVDRQTCISGTSVYVFLSPCEPHFFKLNYHLLVSVFGCSLIPHSLNYVYGTDSNIWPGTYVHYVLMMTIMISPESYIHLKTSLGSTYKWRWNKIHHATMYSLPLLHYTLVHEWVVPVRIPILHIGFYIPCPEIDVPPALDSKKILLEKGK